MPAPPPVRPSTIKQFLQDRTQLRVSEEAISHMVDLLTTLSDKIALRASQFAVAEQRNTLLNRDIQNAFESFLGESGPPLLSIETLHSAINGISTDNLKDLIQRLRQDLELHS
jgi:histone H3/H4